ncbi:MAG: SpoIIE family protein phosphatase [Candidatus Eremiobacteraeota bacterium]|nr:SpoIIE family protein phosphatase [Candidatus Eremiobacteraeota bacterium]
MRDLHEPSCSGALASLEAGAWSTVADAYPAMLFMASANGTMEWINRRCHQVTGVPCDFDASQFWLSLVHPAHLSEVLASWQQATATRQPFSEELLCRFADGQYHWVVAKAESVLSATERGRWFGTILEIDDRKEIERALLKSELRFRALTDNIEQIVCVADADWNVTYLNRRYAEYTGIPLAQALGSGWRRAIPEGEMEFLERALSDATATGQLSYEYRLYHSASGSYRWNWVRAHRVSDLAGANAQWFGTITDIHDQRAVIEKKNEALDAFQLALLPRQIAAVPNCGVSTLYVSASEEARIGGDWYDCFDLGDGRYGVSIGDVVGHGLEASAAMSRIRQYLSAAAEEESDPVTVIRRTNTFILRRNLPVATAIFGILDTSRRVFQFCSAGHPAPIVIKGERAELAGGASVPLGVMTDTTFGACAIDLSDASQLVLYTDGVLEYSRDLLTAERYLLVAAAVTARLQNPASRAAEIVKRTMGAHPPGDDIAMLVFSFDVGGGSTVSHRLETLMSWQFDSRDSRVAYRVREQVLQFLRELSNPDQELFEVKAVIGELIANAVEHAPGEVHLEVDWSGDRAVLRMRDHGPGFTANASLPRDMMSEDGRGLYLISVLADDLRASSHFEGGAEVSVRLRLHKHHAA